MKQLLILLTVTILAGCKKEAVDPKLQDEFTISSLETGRNYKISIHLPEQYYDSDEKYSTLYVLDSKQDKDYVGKICNRVSKDVGTSNVIVVGIGYEDSNDRDVDYTPTLTSHGKGGSEQFMDFISHTLIPHIETTYRAEGERKSRIIIGHSFGGLLGAYAFVKHNHVFGNYLLLSPSLFYDHSIILKFEQEVRTSIKDNSQLVFIGAGSTEKGLLPANDLFYQRLTSHYRQTLTKFDIVPGKGHLTSKDVNIENAIDFYFKNR
jgi:predicted alpha/beta superfamily hydrolase